MPTGRQLTFSLNLGVAMAASTVLGFAFGAIGPLLRESLEISRSDLGLLSTAFLATGAIFSPVVGGVIQSVGSRRGLLGLSLYCTAGFAVISIAPTFGWLVAAAAAAGVAGAFSNPLTNHAIAEYDAAGSRGTILGVKQSGVQMGVFIGGAALPSIGLRFGWRVALLSLAVLPLIVFLLTLRMVPRREKVVKTSEGGLASLIAIARQKPFLVWVAVYALLMGGATSATNVYLSLYTFERLGFSIEVAGLVVSLIGLVGIPARVIWGRRVDQRAGALARDLMAVALVSTASIALVILSARLEGGLVWVAAALLGGITTAWNVMAMMSTIRDLPAIDSAKGTGLIQLGFYIGLLSGPFFFGLALGESGRYVLAWTGVAAAFAAAAAVAFWSGRTLQAGAPEDSPSGTVMVAT